MNQFGHLARRAVGSMSNRSPSGEGERIARGILNADEFRVWSMMDGRDRVHSLTVLRRLDVIIPGASVEVRAAALLHDVGKTASGLGWAGRVAATLVGPRVARFRTYADHEAIGARMIKDMSAPLTVELVAGRGPSDIASALRRADDI